MQWYYVKNGEKAGPFSNADLPGLVHRGEIGDDTLVWNEAMPDWLPYGEVKTSEPPLDAPAEPTAEESAGQTDCALCGKSFPPEELIAFEGQHVCAGCKPAFIQQMKENAELSGALVMNYAGFWIRVGASFIDGIIMYALQMPIGFLFGLVGASDPNGAVFWVPLILMYAVQMLIPALYSILMVGKYGATLGKKAVGIKVVMADGGRVSYGRATGRYFAKMLSGMILYIGYLMVAFDDEKRGLHDHICSTRVIRK